MWNTTREKLRKLTVTILIKKCNRITFPFICTKVHCLTTDLSPYILSLPSKWQYQLSSCSGQRAWSHPWLPSSKLYYIPSINTKSNHYHLHCYHSNPGQYINHQYYFHSLLTSFSLLTLLYFMLHKEVSDYFKRDISSKYSWFPISLRSKL